MTLRVLFIVAGGILSAAVIVAYHIVLIKLEDRVQQIEQVLAALLHQDSPRK